MEKSQNLVNILSTDIENCYNSSLDLFKDTNVNHGTKPKLTVNAIILGVA